jgi:hypothetical protein
VIISKPAPLYCIAPILCSTASGCAFNRYAALCAAFDAYRLTAIAVEQEVNIAINWCAASVALDRGCGWHVFSAWANKFKC